MITDHTVFVLGAGSSTQYGFPSGVQLKEWMVSQALTNGMWSKPLEEISVPPELIDAFRKALIASPDDSIDAVLSRRPQLGPLGRFMIARRIAECEQEKSIFPPKGWYKELFHMLRLDDDSIGSPSLTVVTFNYDRSFEFYLWNTIRSALEGQGQNIATHKMRGVRISHVHGSLGDIQSIPFGLGGDLASVSKVFENIRVVSDSNLDSAPEFHDARKMIANAQRVVIVGFGFDPTNMARLGLESCLGNIPVLATCHKLRRVDELKTKYGEAITFLNTKADGVLTELRKML